MLKVKYLNLEQIFKSKALYIVTLFFRYLYMDRSHLFHVWLSARDSGMGGTGFNPQLVLINNLIQMVHKYLPQLSTSIYQAVHGGFNKLASGERVNRDIVIILCIKCVVYIWA